MTGSVLVGSSACASPWAVFDELSRRGYSIGITAGRELALRGTASRPTGGVIHAVEAASVDELAVLLAGWIRAWERS